MCVSISACRYSLAASPASIYTVTNTLVPSLSPQISIVTKTPPDHDPTISNDVIVTSRHILMPRTRTQTCAGNFPPDWSLRGSGARGGGPGEKLLFWGRCFRQVSLQWWIMDSCVRCFLFSRHLLVMMNGFKMYTQLSFCGRQLRIIMGGFCCIFSWWVPIVGFRYYTHLLSTCLAFRFLFIMMDCVDLCRRCCCCCCCWCCCCCCCCCCCWCCCCCCWFFCCCFCCCCRCC